MKRQRKILRGKNRRPSAIAVAAALTLYNGTPCADDLPRCGRCGFGYERFNSLAYHLANDCPARQTGPNQENDTMAKNGKTNRGSSRESTRDTRRGRNDGESKYPPFLSADDLPERGIESFTIADSITLYQGDDGRASLFIQVKNRAGKLFTWSVRTNSPDRIALYNQVGRNLVKWPGEKVKLYAVQGDRGGWFVNLYEPERDRD